MTTNAPLDLDTAVNKDGVILPSIKQLNIMGSEQSVQKAISSAKKRQDTSLVFRGDSIDPKWIPEEDVTTLKLEIVKLIDMRFQIVPSVLYQISTIKQLDLSENKLVSVTGIGALVNLTDLDLTGNMLDYLPDDLTQCKNLSFLNISKNMLTIRSLPPGFFDGRVFSSIDISENKFAKMTSELMTLLNSSESVTIHSNPWDIIELRSLLPSSTEEHVKTLLKVLKSTIIASGLNAAANSPTASATLKEKPVISPKPAAQQQATSPYVPLQSPISQEAAPSTENSDSSASTTKKRSDSILKRISLNLGKPPKLEEESQVSPPKRDSEVSSPPVIPPPRPDQSKSAAGPPPVSKSPAAAVAPPPPARTQDALRTPSRPSGPKGRKLPTTDFIESNAREEEIILLAKDGKSEIPVSILINNVVAPDGPPPSVPSKTSRPSKNSITVPSSSGNQSLVPSTPTSAVHSRDVSSSYMQNRPTLVKEKDNAFMEVAEVPSEAAEVTDSRLVASPPPTGKKPPGGISMFGGSLPTKPHHSAGSSKIEETELRGHKSQVSEAGSTLQRQNTLTDHSQAEQTPTHSKKQSSFMGKKPIGGVSMFGGSNLSKENEINERGSDGDESLKKSDTIRKDSSAAASSSVGKKPDVHPKPEIGKAASSSQNPSAVAATGPPTSAGAGKKPPVGGISMFGGPPPAISTEPKEEPTSTAIVSPASPAVAKKESPGKKLFSMFGGNSTPPPAEVKETKEQSPTKKDIPPTKEKEVPVISPKRSDSLNQSPASPQTNRATKKPPVGGVSMFGGPPGGSEEGSGNSGTLKKPPPGAVSMFGGAGMPLPPKNVTTGQTDESTPELTPSELRERLKQQLSSNQVDSAPPKPGKPSTLPRGFKPSDMETTPNPPLPSKPLNSAKSVEKLSGK